MLRQVLLSASRSQRLRRFVETAPVSNQLVARYVAGTEHEDAVRVAKNLVGDGLTVTVGHLGEHTQDRAGADASRDAYFAILEQLSRASLTASVEVSVKLSAIGQALPMDGEKIALDNTSRICEAAKAVGTTVTLDMEDHTTTDSTLSILRELRKDFPWVGAVVQSYLRRTEGDCRDLAHEGSRVRLCKGAYKEPESVAFQKVADVDKSYVRCLKILLAGGAYPMIASHDPRLIEIAGSLAAQHRYTPGRYEYQMLYGVRPAEQRRLARIGETVRVYIPYGTDWYGYLIRRMAERPANLAVFLRSLLSKR